MKATLSALILTLLVLPTVYASSTMSYDTFNQYTFIPTVRLATSIECNLCEYFVGVCDNYISSNRTETRIAEVLDSLCEKVIEPLETPCEEFVDTYIPYLMNLLVNRYLKPNQVCIKLHQCESTTVLRGNLECPLCELLFGYLQDYVGQNKVEESLEKTLESACSHLLPKNASHYCDILVEQYLPELVLFFEEQPPEKFCNIIHAC